VPAGRARQQAELVAQAVQQRSDAQRFHPRRGQLNRQWQRVEARYQPGHRRAGLAAHGEMRVDLTGPVGEQRDCRRPVG
jgi:hypothetical protein